MSEELITQLEAEIVRRDAQIAELEAIVPIESNLRAKAERVAAELDRELAALKAKQPSAGVVDGYVLVPVEPTEIMQDAGCAAMPTADCHPYDAGMVYKAMLAAIKAGQGEAVAWQFFQDGKWWNGDERIKDHRTNTKAAGYPIRDLYTNPPASADAVSVAPGLERAIQIVREVAKTQPGYSDEREAIFEALSEAYVEAMAPPCTSAAARLVPRELLGRPIKCYEDGMSIYGECEELRTLPAAPSAKKESGHYSDQDWINAGCPRNEESDDE